MSLRYTKQIANWAYKIDLVKLCHLSMYGCGHQPVQNCAMCTSSLLVALRAADTRFDPNVPVSHRMGSACIN